MPRVTRISSAFVLFAIAASPMVLTTGSTAADAHQSPAAKTSVPSLAFEGGGVGCAPGRFERASRVHPNRLDRVALNTHHAKAILRDHAAKDDTLLVDDCDRLVVSEPKDPIASQAAVNETQTSVNQPTSGAPVVPLGDTFALASRPGSDHTVYLNFRGGTVAGTAWNSQYSNGAPITVAPYSMDSTVDTNFSTAELVEIQKAWQVVAEDYAPFDVNVTLATPTMAALDRLSDTDTQWGQVAYITNNGPVRSACGCAGIAYTDVASATGDDHTYYQPAWVFTDSTGISGRGIAEASSHELGHNFGLLHDGITDGASYYTGYTPWAPIMGSAYLQPLSEWSSGEYSGANNQEDDIAKITATLGGVADDFGDTLATAGAIVDGKTIRGVLTTRADMDAFKFTSAGPITLSATPTWMGNADLRMRIFDVSGNLVTIIEPNTGKSSAYQASGTDATWTASLPETGATYYAIVGGMGQGNPSDGGYSDYDSMGNYQLKLSSSVQLTATTPPGADASAPYSARPVTTTSGTAPFTWYSTGLPAGLTIDSSTGTVSGTPTTAGSFDATITAVDANNTQGSKTVTFNVAPALVTTLTTPPSGSSGYAYTATPVTASGGKAPYAWSATGLPDGLEIQAGTGTVTGTPASGGTWNSTVKVTDANGYTSSRTVTFTISGSTATTSPSPTSSATPTTSPSPTATATPTTSPSPTSGATTTSSPSPSASTTTSSSTTTTADPGPITVIDSSASGRVRVAFSKTMTAKGGNQPYTWSSSGLPSGLSINASTGVVSGTPTTYGTFRATIKVTGPYGGWDTGTVTITIERGYLTFDTSSIPNAPLNQWYARGIAGFGGYPDYTFSKVSGSLPPGMYLYHTTGTYVAVRGTPTKKGTWSFKLQMKDQKGQLAFRTYSLTVT
jgi:hypothetical protein